MKRFFTIFLICSPIFLANCSKKSPTPVLESPHATQAHLDPYTTSVKMAQLAEGTNHPTVAIHAYENALQINPKSIPAHFAAARLYERSKKWDKAQEQYRMIYNLNPKEPDIQRHVGRMSFRLHLYESAAIWWIKAAYDSHDAKAYNNLGVLLSTTGHAPEAILCYKKGLSLASEDAVLWHNLSLSKKGHYNDAELPPLTDEAVRKIASCCEKASPTKTVLSLLSLPQPNSTEILQ